MYEKIGEESLKTEMIPCSALTLTNEDYVNISLKAREYLDVGIKLSYLTYLIGADADSVRKPNTDLYCEYLLKYIKTRIIYHEQDTLSDMSEGRTRFLIGIESLNLISDILEEIAYESNWDFDE